MLAARLAQQANRRLGNGGSGSAFGSGAAAVALRQSYTPLHDGRGGASSSSSSSSSGSHARRSGSAAPRSSGSVVGASPMMQSFPSYTAAAAADSQKPNQRPKAQATVTDGLLRL